MRELERLEETVAIAESRGFDVRYEWLGGGSGGACAFGGKKWIFVDLALSVGEQLQQVSQAMEMEQGQGIVPKQLPAFSGDQEWLRHSIGSSIHRM